jgi:hypothetical protein
MELDPKYMDVIVRRWQTLSGEQARLEEDPEVPVLAVSRFNVMLTLRKVVPLTSANDTLGNANARMTTFRNLCSPDMRLSLLSDESKHVSVPVVVELNFTFWTRFATWQILPLQPTVEDRRDGDEAESHRAFAENRRQPGS